MRTSTLALAGALIVAAGSAAEAQADTIFGAPGSQVVHVGSIYIGGGPQFQSFGMPKYNLGFPLTDAAFNDLGAQFEHSLRGNSLGGNAMIGYVFGSLPPWLGENPRIELGGFYTAGLGHSEAKTNRAFGASNLLNGFNVGFGCNPCDWTSQLTRNVNAFRIALHGGSDFRVGPNLYPPPSIGVFGGHVRVSDELFQTFQFPGFALGPNDNYRASSNLTWWDVGGRGKLVLTYKPAPWIAVFAGGHVDVASRHVNLAASDAYLSGAFQSSISDSATRLNVTAGGQIGVTFIGGNWLLVSLIGGAEYDARVPRVQRPFGGNFNVNQGTFQTPARLAFSSAINYSAQFRIIIRIF